MRRRRRDPRPRPHRRVAAARRAGAVRGRGSAGRPRPAPRRAPPASTWSTSSPRWSPRPTSWWWPPPLAAARRRADEVAAAVAGLERSPTVTDVGSVKAPIAALGRGGGLPDPSAFVAGHPLAGTERSGWASADAGLFAGTTWALSVDEPVALDRWATVARLALRPRVEVVPVDATTSTTARRRPRRATCPYLLAGLLAGAVDADAHPALARSLAAGSLASLTRVVRRPTAHASAGSWPPPTATRSPAEIDAFAARWSAWPTRLSGERRRRRRGAVRRRPAGHALLDAGAPARRGA